MLEVRFLGAFEVKCDKGLIHISGRHEQTLFAYLVLNNGILHRREKLASLLWPDSVDGSARENLRHILWRIRKTLPVEDSSRFLQADDLSIMLSGGSDLWLDADILRSAKAQKTADSLMTMLDVYHGELLPGFTEEWAVLEREYIDSIYEHHMARLMALLQKEKRWLDILEWGERWLSFGKRSEPAYRALMQAHSEMGEMSEVAATYTRCVRSLAELGLEVSPQTLETYEFLAQNHTPKTKKTL